MLNLSGLPYQSGLRGSLKWKKKSNGPIRGMHVRRRWQGGGGRSQSASGQCSRRICRCGNGVTDWLHCPVAAARAPNPYQETKYPGSGRRAIVQQVLCTWSLYWMFLRLPLLLICTPKVVIVGFEQHSSSAANALFNNDCNNQQPNKPPSDDTCYTPQTILKAIESGTVSVTSGLLCSREQSRAVDGRVHPGKARQG